MQHNREKDLQIWAMLYAGLCAFLAHPGNKKQIQEADIETMAAIADHMLTQYKKREVTWAG